MATPSQLASRSIRNLSATLAVGHHALVTGSIGDTVFLRGEPLDLRNAIGRLASTLFEVVVHINAVDSATIVSGAEVFERHRGAIGLPPGAVISAAGRGRPAAENDPSNHMDLARSLLTQDRFSVAILVDQADLILQDPAIHDMADRRSVGSLLLGLNSAGTVRDWTNTAILLASTAENIPPQLRTAANLDWIEVQSPSREERLELARMALGSLPDEIAPPDADREAIAGALADLTDGEDLSTVSAIVAFARHAAVPISDTRGLVNLFRYGPREDHWGHLLSDDGGLERITRELSSQIFGQAEAVRRVTQVIAGAAQGLTFRGGTAGNEGQPRGVMLFVGPTGTGKTEMAKAIANALFRDPEAYVRLDMSGFQQPHEVSRLIGSPPGFVGYEEGGQLTGPVLSRPAIVILLDEIEKAHPAVFRMLLSILEDGRINDSQGRVVYFGEAIIIATSNEGAQDVVDLVAADGYDVPYERIREMSVAALEEMCRRIQLAEFFGRIEPGIVAFDILRPDVVDLITLKLISGFALTEGPRVVFDETTTCAHMRNRLADPASLRLGGRKVRNEFRRLGELLATWIATRQLTREATVEVSFVDGRMVASVDGQPPVRVSP